MNYSYGTSLQTSRNA